VGDLCSQIGKVRKTRSQLPQLPLHVHTSDVRYLEKYRGIGIEMVDTELSGIGIDIEVTFFQGIDIGIDIEYSDQVSISISKFGINRYR
jgi:hypothetical protein